MESLDKLKLDCSICRACRLCEGRHNLVFGDGNAHADIMFIGEGPGEQEDLQGIPFVGPAGKLLDDMLEIIDLDRSKVYIANIVKCRPPMNRDPSPDEREACIGWLKSQMECVDPKIVICLGRIAATTLIREDFKITKEHGCRFDIGGRVFTATYHPSALLRDPYKRPEAFCDLVLIRDMIRSLGIVI